MPLNDTISSLATDFTCVVSRRVAGTYVDGIYTRATPTTLTIDCVTEPAFNLNRVIGGANLLPGGIEGQQATDVRQLWTTTELFTVSKNNDADEIRLQGKDWTVARVERWDLSGEVHFHCVITAIGLGGTS